MALVENLINGTGFQKIQFEKIERLERLRYEILRTLSPSTSQNFINIDLYRRKLAKMKDKQINYEMIKLLKKNDISEKIINSCPKIVKKLSGSKIFLQRRAHVIIKTPGNKNTKTLPHYEMMSGISPYTYIIWAPLHDLEGDDGGIYYLDQRKSLSIIKKEEKLYGFANGEITLNTKVNLKKIQIKFGEAIIFNPFVMHGNNFFKSSLARIAINVRFQSANKPLLQKDTDYFKYLKLN
tara:strand:+ start:5075 stop:5788 length:714 start_codon:yes stop_codon:yes gene_type:complete